MIAQENNRVQSTENGPGAAHRGDPFGVHGWRVIVFQGVLFWIAAKFPRRIYVRALGIIHPIQSVVRCCAFTLLAFGLTYLGSYAGAYLLLAAVGAITLLLFWLIDVTPVSTGMTADDAR